VISDTGSFDASVIQLTDYVPAYSCPAGGGGDGKTGGGTNCLDNVGVNVAIMAVAESREVHTDGGGSDYPKNAIAVLASATTTVNDSPQYSFYGTNGIIFNSGSVLIGTNDVAGVADNMSDAMLNLSGAEDMTGVDYVMRVVRGNSEPTFVMKKNGAVGISTVASDVAVADEVMSYTGGGHDSYHLGLGTPNGDASYMFFNNSDTGYGADEGVLMGMGGSKEMIFFNRENNYAAWAVNNSYKMRLETDGDLHVTGDVIGYSSTPSDIRLKTNIRPLSSSLDTICKLNGIKFDWKYKKDTEFTNQLGLIAQEVEKVVPEVVQEKQLPFYASSSISYDATGKEERDDDTKEYKIVNYEQLVPHLIESIKELKLEIDDLKNKLGNK
jgi:hypothetical protein